MLVNIGRDIRTAQSSILAGLESMYMLLGHCKCRCGATEVATSCVVSTHSLIPVQAFYRFQFLQYGLGMRFGQCVFFLHLGGAVTGEVSFSRRMSGLGMRL